jgi:septal ring factor EnvC (AmiA/AmiB activator)
LFETHNRLQTCSLKLKTLQKALKNHDKELVTIKGQLSKVQHENHNLLNKLNDVEQATRKLRTYIKSMLSLTNSIR